jgi:GT2 family glycosyltransferase
MDKDPKVAIIILNWNGWQDTLECLESLYKINYFNYKVLVVDNGSKDESLDKIQDYTAQSTGLEIINYGNGEFTQKLNSPGTGISNKDSFNGNLQKNDLILIENDKNYGFAQGNNIGIEFVLKNLKADYILLLNNDTVVDENFLRELVKKAEEDDKIGFLGSKTYFYHDPNVIQAAGGSNIDFKHGESLRIGYGQEDKDPTINPDSLINHDHEVDYIMGSCILVRKKVIEEIGLLDTVYFTYWEDADWCIRGRESGYKSMYVHQSKIWHKEGTSSPSTSRIYYHSRNRLYFMKKNAKDQYYSFLLYYIPFIFIERLIHYIKVNDLKTYSFMLRGMLDGFRL